MYIDESVSDNRPSNSGLKLSTILYLSYIDSIASGRHCMKQIGEKNDCIDIPNIIKTMLSGNLNIYEGPININPIVEIKK